MREAGGGGSSAVAAARLWFEVDARAFEELADQLEKQWRSWAAASDEVGRIFGAMSSGVVWSGAAASTATDFKDEQHQLYAEAEQACRRACDAVDGFIGVLRARQRSIDDALCDREHAVYKVGQAQQELASLKQVEAASATGLPETQAAQDQVEAARRAVAGCDERLLSTVRALQAEDAGLASDLQVCVRSLESVAQQQRGSAWLGSMTTPSMAMRLGAAQFQMGPAEVALWQYVLESGGAPLDPADTRRLLAAVDVRRRLQLSSAIPGVAEAVSRDTYTEEFLSQYWPIGSVEDRFFRIVAKRGGFPTDPQQVAGYMEYVGEQWDALSPDEQAYLIAMYPGVIGTTRGVDPQANFKANRIALRGAIHRTELLEGIIKRHRVTKPYFTTSTSPNVIPLLAELGYMQDINSHRGRQSDRMIDFYKERRATYTNMLEARFDENPGNGERQFLYFNPKFDGGATEVVGVMNKDTSNVGIFVPGTGSVIEDFHEGKSIDSARGFLSKYDPTQNAAILESSFDSPNDVADGNASMNHYSVAAAPIIISTAVSVRHMAPSARSTLAGHSYGGAVVGIADSLGAPVDRVVFISSPGIGTGVTSSDDVAKKDILGNTRINPDGSPKVERYSITPEDDAITLVRPFLWLEHVRGPVGHGQDPDDEYTRVSPGRYHDDYQLPEFAGRTLDSPGNPLSDLEMELLSRKQYEAHKRTIDPTYRDEEIPDLERRIEEAEKNGTGNIAKHPHVDSHKPNTDSSDRVGEIMFDEVNPDSILPAS